jgi:hypothetical protein
MKIAASKAIKTERLKRARAIAIKGGSNPKSPYSIDDPYVFMASCQRNPMLN